MREVTSRKAVANGERITVHGIYVRSDVAMPEVGEDAVVINPDTADEFMARVIAVNRTKRVYDLRVDLRRPV